MRALKWLLAALALLGAAAVAVGVYFVTQAPERAVRAALAYERGLAGLARREAILPDGLRIVYLEGGRGAPLVLLHGFGANKDNFTRVARYLTPHYRLIVPDLVGFGESSHPPKADYAPRAQAERLRTFLRGLGVAKLHLGGNSMGGHIALKRGCGDVLEQARVLHAPEIAGVGADEDVGFGGVALGAQALQQLLGAAGERPHGDAGRGFEGGIKLAV